MSVRRECGPGEARAPRCRTRALTAHPRPFLRPVEPRAAHLRAAHERNDEVLERIYIGRRFKNDTERLEKLFDLYTKMTAQTAKTPTKKTGRGKK